MRMGRYHARRLWEGFIAPLPRELGRLVGSSPSGKHAVDSKHPERTRRVLGITALLAAAVALASSSLPAAPRVVASRTYTASDWPGLGASRALAPATGASVAVTQSTGSLPPACAAGFGDGTSATTPSYPAPASTTSAPVPPPTATAAPAAPASGSQGQTPAPASESGSSASSSQPSRSPQVRASTSSYVAPGPGANATSTSATPQAVLDVAMTGGDTSQATGQKATLVDSQTPASASSTTSTSTTTTTVPAKTGAAGSLSAPLSGATTTPVTIPASGASPVSSLEKALQDLVGAGGVTTSSQPGSSSALEPLAPLPSSGASGSSSSQPSAAPPQTTTSEPGAQTGLDSVPLDGSPFGSSMEIGCQLVSLGQVGALAPGETAAQEGAVEAALGLLGTPYVWGGESKNGFDCSGLVQFVFDSVGVQLPRVAQDQYDAGPAVPPGSPVVPGDLVFFGSSQTDVVHVGIFAGDGLMIDAPHTGAVVRFDRVEGFMPIVGITSPGGQQIA